MNNETTVPTEFVLYEPLTDDDDKEYSGLFEDD